MSVAKSEFQREHPDISVDVKECQRCGGDHDGMAFMALFNPTDGFEYYGFCSETAQPVLLEVREKQG